MRAFRGQRVSSRTQSAGSTPCHGRASTAISRTAAGGSSSSSTPSRPAAVTGSPSPAQAPGRAQDGAGPQRPQVDLVQAVQRLRRRPSALGRAAGRPAASPPAAGRAGPRRDRRPAAWRPRWPAVARPRAPAPAAAPPAPPARPGRPRSTIGGQPGRALDRALDAAPGWAAARSGTRPCPPACGCRSRPPRGGSATPWTPGASSSARRYASAPSAFRKVSGSWPSRQLDHVDLEPFLEQHVEALARRLLPGLVLVEVHHHALGEAPQQARVRRRSARCRRWPPPRRRRPRGRAPRRGSPPSVRRGPPRGCASFAQDRP